MQILNIGVEIEWMSKYLIGSSIEWESNIVEKRGGGVAQYVFRYFQQATYLKLVRHFLLTMVTPIIFLTLSVYSLNCLPYTIFSLLLLKYSV